MTTPSEDSHEFVPEAARHPTAAFDPAYYLVPDGKKRSATDGFAVIRRKTAAA